MTSLFVVFFFINDLLGQTEYPGLDVALGDQLHNMLISIDGLYPMLSQCLAQLRQSTLQCMRIGVDHHD